MQIASRPSASIVRGSPCRSSAVTRTDVERSTSVRVTALDGLGEPQTIEAEGLLAVCIQHELDHLLGKVFVEYLSPLKRNRIKSKLLKQQREDQKLEQREGRR